MIELTPESVIVLYPWQRAIKTTPVRIRPITEDDIQCIGPTFLDLEQRTHRVAVGRYLCVGVQNERWTCGEQSMEAREAISEPDTEGFRLYRQRDPQPVLVTFIEKPFCLTTYDNKRWISQAGVITWNGEQGDQIIMRVIDETVFSQTYQLLTE